MASKLIEPMKPSKMRQFQTWLLERGAQILEPTSEFEMIRFRANDLTAVIYRNNKNRWTGVNGAGEAVKAFTLNEPWRALSARKKRFLGQYAVALLKRDGDSCFFCGLPMRDEDISVEHLCPRAHHGPDHLSNMALSHRKCNSEAGALSVVEKVALRDQMRSRPQQAAA